jgi:hypothetical protein
VKAQRRRERKKVAAFLNLFWAPSGAFLTVLRTVGTFGASARFRLRGFTAKSSGREQRKKLLLLSSREAQTPQAQIKKSLFASFSSEKEALPSFPTMRLAAAAQLGNSSGDGQFRPPA